MLPEKFKILNMSNINTTKNINWIVPILLFTVLVVVDIHHTRSHYKFLNDVKRYVNTNTEIVHVEDTDIKHQDYGWFWTYPTLSMLLREDNSKGMVLNDKTYEWWEPFNGRTDQATVDISKYYVNK